VSIGKQKPHKANSEYMSIIQMWHFNSVFMTWKFMKIVRKFMKNEQRSVILLYFQLHSYSHTWTSSTLHIVYWSHQWITFMKRNDYHTKQQKMENLAWLFLLLHELIMKSMFYSIIVILCHLTRSPARIPFCFMRGNEHKSNWSGKLKRKRAKDQNRNRKSTYQL
jgi:hypothetical protein